MPEKPLFAYDYTKENVELVRQTCLYVSTKLGDLLDDIVVVGGLVPSLLIPDESLPAGEDVHIGTSDLDLGLSLAILDRKRYEDLTQRLHRSGFKPDENEEGNTTLQRWKVRTSSGLKVTVDFLIPPSLDAGKGGDLRHIEKEFDADKVQVEGEMPVLDDFKLPPLGGEAIVGNPEVLEILEAKTRLRPVADPELCTACGACIDHCPVSALELRDSFPVVEDHTCITCFCCQEICPEKAITLK